MRKPKLAALFVAALLLIPFIAPVVRAAENTAVADIVISEVQTGGNENANQEFVELYNQTAEVITLAGWQVQYQSATGTTWATKATLNGELLPQGLFMVATSAYGAAQQTMSAGLAAGGGHVRIVDSEGGAVDLVGWGTATHAEGLPAATPDPGNSLQRCMANDLFVDTDNNADDFLQYTATTPNSGVLCPTEELPEEPPVDPPVEPDEINTCSGIIISEVLPNPAGGDSGNEFIELHNTTSTDIPLTGCMLQLNSSSYTFIAEARLPANTYQILNDTELGFTLPNSAGGLVRLLGGNGIEVIAVTYPTNMPDNVSWALLDGGWQLTYLPTPSASNQAQPFAPCPDGQIRNGETGRCAAVAAPNNGPKPCKQGYARNIETNRCRKIVQAGDTRKPCKTGQIRNSATNRCRSVATAANVLVPCKSGQERNPLTNRCRSTAVAANELKPCAPGQERNPETNRCRKATASVTSHPVEVKDVASKSANPVGWWIAGVLGTGALTYAMYEWRQEIGRKIRRFTQARQR
jgi:hypothetical protein